MKKLFIVILLSLSYISYGQKHYVSYKNIMYSWDTDVKTWNTISTTFDDIKITMMGDDVFVESKEMSHYTKYYYFGEQVEKYGSSRKWKVYDEHNRVLYMIVYYYTDEMRISFMYNDVAFSYCISK